MKRTARPMVLTLGLAALLIGAGTLLAQEKGAAPLPTPNTGARNPGAHGTFDPTQFAQLRLDRAKASLEITNDAEWKVVQPLVQKVFDAETAVSHEMRGGRRGPPSGGPAGGPSAPGTPASGPRLGVAPSPEIQALQTAIESKASPDQLKAKITALRNSRKEKEAALTKAQGDLRKALTVRQEANAVLMGLLQ